MSCKTCMGEKVIPVLLRLRDGEVRGGTAPCPDCSPEPKREPIKPPRMDGKEK